MEPIREASLLRRYMSIFELLTLVGTGKMVLKNPMGWEDEADKAFMSAYKSHHPGSGLKAICFTSNPENYHGWKVYGGNLSDVCVVFHGKALINVFNNYDQIEHRMVHYLNLNDVKNRGDINVSDYPFIKRNQYKDEKEYRVISRSLDHVPIHDPVEPLIKEIYLNPWLPVDYVSNARSLIKRNSMFNLSVRKSSMIRSPDWISEAEIRSVRLG